ncbi:sigma factor-like helix-turn-helix DNA-binding protein [Butyrivibrio sp. WCD3002]|uniref:sigma factor-like helix-turn-helix DNA-binding protein n=1 Tax=Butyrivibrio sp. WCD3002 TaxID=1280676 RepID=UPI0004792351|nr:sigma factor-like helix-turn-helix DNA-binding protein [Butyrivibrio sp. WCD3002]
MTKKANSSPKYEYPLNLLRDICKEQGKEELPTSISQETNSILLKMLDDLTEEQKELIQRRYVEGKTFKDIAEYYVVSKQNIHYTIKRILKIIGSKRQFGALFWDKGTTYTIETLEDLELSNRVYYALVRQNITTLQALKGLGLNGVAQLRSIGIGALAEIEYKAGFLWE